MERDEFLRVKKEIKRDLELYKIGFEDINSMFLEEVCTNDLFKSLIDKQLLIQDRINDRALSFTDERSSVNTIFLNKDQEWVIELMNDFFEIKYINITRDDFVDEDLWI